MTGAPKKATTGRSPPQPADDVCDNNYCPDLVGPVRPMISCRRRNAICPSLFRMQGAAAGPESPRAGRAGCVAHRASCGPWISRFARAALEVGSSECGRPSRIPSAPSAASFGRPWAVLAASPALSSGARFGRGIGIGGRLMTIGVAVCRLAVE
jgi:hypothetical protein